MKKTAGSKSKVFQSARGGVSFCFWFYHALVGCDGMKQEHQRLGCGSGWHGGGLLLLAFLLVVINVRADADHCAICGAAFGETIYTMTDKVTHKKIEVCHACSIWPDDCYLCGLPVRKNFTKLADDRFICARDVKSEVLDSAEALQICTEIRDGLNRHLSSFMAFPETNVDVRVVDRIDLLAFKIPGNDYGCPNILGYISPETNQGEVRYPLRLMSALPRAQLKATCAHEYTHAWVFQNVPGARRKTLGHDAHEGFCELIAYLLMEAQHEPAELQAILDNGYTRGQVDLFVEAASKYGLNDVIDWMKYGEDAELKAGEVWRVRNVQMPPRPPATNTVNLTASPPPAAPDTLLLRSLSASPTRAFALINDVTLAVGETGKAHIGSSNLLIRCLAIGADFVRIRIETSGEERELRYKNSR